MYHVGKSQVIYKALSVTWNPPLPQKDGGHWEILGLGGTVKFQLPLGIQSLPYFFSGEEGTNNKVY